MEAKSSHNNAFKTQKTKSTINGKIRRKKQRLSYKKDYPNYGNIFSDKIPVKRTKLKIPPMLKPKRASQKKKKTLTRIIRSKKSKKVSLPLQKGFHEKKLVKPLKKDISHGTGISVNSSFSTAQNMGGYTNSNCENKFRPKPKRGILTVEECRKKMFNKFSHKNISIGSKVKQTRNCDSERTPKNDKVLYLAEQPERENYDTQKLIETISYDKKYKPKSSIKKKHKKVHKKMGNEKDHKKKKISLKQSFESDKERGFKPIPNQMKSGNDNTFSFNNLSETKFSSMKKPIKKVKRQSRLVSDNKNSQKVKNVFLDEDDNEMVYKGTHFSEAKNKNNKFLEKNIFHLI